MYLPAKFSSSACCGIFKTQWTNTHRDKLLRRRKKKRETIILIKFFQAIEKEKIYLKVAMRGTFFTWLKK